MEQNSQKSLDSNFFSVSFGLVLVHEPLPYGLFINSSTHAKRERFVCISKRKSILMPEDLITFREKYYQLYIREEEREAYLKSIVSLGGVEDNAKVEVIKDSAIKYLESIFDQGRGFTNEVLEETIQGCRDSVESMIDVIQDYGITDVQKLIAELSFHDFYTYDHSINVSMYSISILKALKPKATRKEMLLAGMGGLLHDLGKIKIPTSIINNPGKLSDTDFEIIKKHPEYGLELFDGNIGNHDDLDFETIKRVIGEHHENYNGTGYPNKLEGKEISIFARITAIADFYDAITTKRSYHEVLSTEDALNIMHRSVGRKIDPKIFDVFRNNVNVILSGKTNKELPDDFDPCQPLNVLPLEKPEAKVQRSDFIKKETEDYGKVKTSSEKKKEKKKKAS